MAPPSIPIGTLIKSRWKVIRKIGQGAFGTQFIHRVAHSRARILPLA